MDISDIQKFEDAVDKVIKGTGAAEEKISVEQTKVPDNDDDEANEVMYKNGNDLNGDSGHSSLDDSSLKTCSPGSDRNEHSTAPAINGIDEEKPLVSDVDNNSMDSQATVEELRDAGVDNELPLMTPIEDVIGMREGLFPASPSVAASMPELFSISEHSNGSLGNDAKSHEEAEPAIKIIRDKSVDEKPDDPDSSFDDEDERLVIDEPSKCVDQSEGAISEDDEDLSDESVSSSDDSEDELLKDVEGLTDEDDLPLADEEELTAVDKENPIEEPLSVPVDEDNLLEEENPPPQPEDKTPDDKSVDTKNAPSNEPATSTSANDESLICHEEFRSPEKASKSAPPNDNDDLLDKLILELTPTDPVPPPAKAPVPRKEGQKRSFVDSLLSKIRESSDSSESESPSKLQKLLSESEDDLLVEIETPIRFNAPKNPNLLATPIVRNQKSASSAFVSNEEEYNQMVAKHKVTRKPSHLEDRSQMGSKSQPPRMQAPDVLSNAQRPRTLAEKRQLINGNNLKVLMLEQESKIYRQVQRKNSKMDINYQLLDSMINEDVPISSGPFRVLTWLRTREGNFIQNFVNVNGANYKLNGSRGNHKAKYLPDLTTKPFPSRQTTFLRPNRCCAGGRISRRTFEAVITSKSVKKFVLETATDVHMRLDTKLLDNQLTSIKPRPLSKKIDFINANRKDFVLDEDAAYLGDYSTYTMPKISIEVKVLPKTALDPCAKRYLKEILPHRDLTENWCEFALTALTTKDEDEETSKDTFEFSVPYVEDKRCILVRDILRKQENHEQLRIQPYTEEDEDEDDMEWTFCKDYDKTDEVESEVVEVIKDLTNSVFINLNDDLFTQEDPNDRNIASTISPMKVQEAIDELSNLPKFDPVKKTLKELKRLNANVFKSDSTCIDDENDMRRHATAHLAKDEREMRTTVIVTDSDTILLGNQQKESRRIKRAPKKFEDYLGQDGHHDEPLAKKSRIKPECVDSAYKQKIEPGTLQSYEDNKAIKKEVRHMIHCCVDVQQLDCLQDLEPWCMAHQLYKCQCKGITVPPEPVQLKLPTLVKVVEPPPKPVQSRRIFPVLPPTRVSSGLTILPKQTPVTTTPSAPVLTQKDSGMSKRTSPVEIISSKDKTQQRNASAVISSSDGLPKIEIVNLGDLINGRKGPIYISIHDSPTMRLNHILMSVLNNKSAIVSFDETAYFIDKKRIDVKKLDFTSIINDLENPIFIIQSKDTGAPSEIEKNDKIIFSKDSMSVIPITDKAALSEISEIIESILRNVRKKIKAQLGDNPTEHVKQQLEMLTSRSRSVSRSNDSASSTQSSPLSFQGKKLEEAPPPGLESALMEQFNKIFSIRMKTLVALVRSNTLGLCPSRELLNKFYIYQWNLLLKSFEEDLIQFWQVTLEGENGGKYNHLVMTDSREVPDVEHAAKENILNIRNLSLSDPITELTRLIILRIENASTKNLTVLLYGCKGYFRVCGMLNSKDSYINGFIAKPNRATHPRVTAKIQKIYHIWYASKSAQIKKQLLEEQEQKKKEKSEVTINSNPLGSIAKKPGQSDYKWFLFNVTNDFSDIYVKNWSRYLSFSVIMQAIGRAKQQKRAIALVPKSEHLKKWPRIYALPAAPLKFKEQDSMTKDFLIFGPYMRSSNSNLLLMQNVDGQLMLRDEYERKNFITRDKRTRCLWIYANTLKCIQDVDSKPITLEWNRVGRPSDWKADAGENDDSSSSVATKSSNDGVSV